MKYLYNPIWFDKHDPKIIEGEPIKEGSIVEITKTKIDSANWFRFIKDNKGNRQSVYKNSLTKLTKRDLRWMPKDPTNLLLTLI